MVTLIAEPKDYSVRALALYRTVGPVYRLPDLKEPAISRVMGEAEVLVIRLAHKIDKAWMERMPKLKIIATPTTGLNHVDLEAAARRGVKVISLKGHTSFLKNIPSTAEETFALIFALVRNIPWAFDHVKEGKWDRDLFRGHQLIHKTLGLLGCGRLGKIVAKYGKAFGMRTIGVDPHVGAGEMRRMGIEKVSMEKLFSESDIVSVHVSFEERTRNLIQEKHLKRMKRSAYLVNTARGEIIDERALLKALEAKWIAGVALDVLANETGKDGKHLKGNPLLAYAKGHRNLIIVPHIGGATFEAMGVTEDFIADLVVKYCKGKK